MARVSGTAPSEMSSGATPAAARYEAIDEGVARDVAPAEHGGEVAEGGRRLLRVVGPEGVQKFGLMPSVLTRLRRLRSTSGMPPVKAEPFQTTRLAVSAFGVASDVFMCIAAASSIM